jgi:hypothetical protein
MNLQQFGRSDIIQNFDQCVTLNDGAAEVRKLGLMLETIREKRGCMNRQSTQRMIVWESLARAFRGKRSYSRKKEVIIESVI